MSNFLGAVPFSIWFFNFTLSLRSRRTPISFSYLLASWYVLAYFVPNVCQFIIFKFYIVTSQLELKISYVSSFLRNLVPFAYFARKDFYESKILKILTLPRSGCQPITHFIRSWDNCAYFVRKDFVVPLALEIQTYKAKKDYLAW